MKRIINSTKTKISNFRKNISSFTHEGVGITVILTLLCIVLIANIYRVIDNGKKNLEVYNHEVAVRNDNRARNDEYTKLLATINSEEYKLLLARDILGLVDGSEELYTTDTLPVYYDRQKKLIEIEEKEGFLDWWRSLIGM